MLKQLSLKILAFLILFLLSSCASKEPLPPSWAFQTSFDSHSPAIGNAGAPVKIQVFTDFACAYCKKNSEFTKELMLEYPGQLYVVFKHLPARSDGKSMIAARAARAASMQNRFWDMHDALFEYGRELSEKEVRDIASLIGLQMRLFAEDFHSPDQIKHIKEDIRMAKSLGVIGTPTYFVNGIPIKGNQPKTVFYSAIDSELRKPAALRR